MDEDQNNYAVQKKSDKKAHCVIPFTYNSEKCKFTLTESQQLSEMGEDRGIYYKETQGKFGRCWLCSTFDHGDGLMIIY